MKYKSSNKN